MKWPAEECGEAKAEDGAHISILRVAHNCFTEAVRGLIHHAQGATFGNGLARQSIGRLDAKQAVHRRIHLLAAFLLVALLTAVHVKSALVLLAYALIF